MSTDGGPRTGLRFHLRRFLEHLRRKQSRAAWGFAAVTLAIYLVLHFWPGLAGDEVETWRGPIEQVLLILFSIAIGAILLPELPAALWQIDATRVRNLIPQEKRDGLLSALVEAESSDPEWTGIVLARALRPLFKASSEPSKYVYDVAYRVRLHLDQVVESAELRAHRLTVSFSSRRVLTDPGTMTVWMSLVRTDNALRNEFREPGCIVREIVPLGALTGRAWQEAIVRECSAGLRINGEPIPLAPDLSVSDVVRFVVGPGFTAPTERTLVETEVSAFLADSVDSFPVMFSGYYCVGQTTVEFEVVDPADAVELRADLFLARALEDRPLRTPVLERTAEGGQRIGFATGDASILWPDSGALFSWPPKSSWLAVPPADLRLPELELPAVAPVTIDVDAVRSVVPGRADELIVIPADLAPHDLYATTPLTRRGPLRLRAEVVARLQQAAAKLPDGFGIAVLDGWRSMSFQRELIAYYRAMHPGLQDGYVSDPDEARIVPPHVTGGAVDLTLSWDGRALALGTDFDDFSSLARPEALEGDATAPLARDLRRLLASVLIDAGFAPYPLEWWHWSYGDQWWAAQRGLPSALYGPVE